MTPGPTTSSAFYSFRAAPHFHPSIHFTVLPGNILVLFQITVGKNHNINLAGLKDLHEHLPKSLLPQKPGNGQPGRPWVFAFVTDWLGEYGEGTPGEVLGEVIGAEPDQLKTIPVSATKAFWDGLFVQRWMPLDEDVVFNFKKSAADQTKASSL